MTREEAIYRLKNTAWLGTDKDREETEQAVDMAIEALIAPTADAPTDTSTIQEKHQLSEVDTSLRREVAFLMGKLSVYEKEAEE